MRRTAIICPPAFGCDKLGTKEVLPQDALMNDCVPLQKHVHLQFKDGK